MICNMGDVLSSELDNCLPIFLDRLKNEITRLTAVKALTLIAGFVFPCFTLLCIDIHPTCK